MSATCEGFHERGAAKDESMVREDLMHSYMPYEFSSLPTMAEDEDSMDEEMKKADKEARKWHEILDRAMAKRSQRSQRSNAAEQSEEPHQDARTLDGREDGQQHGGQQQQPGEDQPARRGLMRPGGQVSMTLLRQSRDCKHLF